MIKKILKRTKKTKSLLKKIKNQRIIQIKVITIYLKKLQKQQSNKKVSKNISRKLNLIYIDLNHVLKQSTNSILNNFFKLYHIHIKEGKVLNTEYRKAFRYFEFQMDLIDLNYTLQIMQQMANQQKKFQKVDNYDGKQFLIKSIITIIKGDKDLKKNYQQDEIKLHKYQSFHQISSSYLNLYQTNLEQLNSMKKNIVTQKINSRQIICNSIERKLKFQIDETKKDKLQPTISIKLLKSLVDFDQLKELTHKLIFQKNQSI